MFLKERFSSLQIWFTLLLWLNLMDIFLTNPAYEANPFTLYLWGKIGILLSAWIKVGQVLFLGVLILLVKKVAKPVEWGFLRKLLLSLLVILSAFYVFVVGWNTILYIIVNL